MREHEVDAGESARTFDRLTGAILDRRYRIDEKLAAGGFGAIYRATDLAMGREVALKILHRDLAGDPSVVERFRREASTLAKLRDPHTVTLYDVGAGADGTHYIVMELLRGESLHARAQAHGGRLPWRRVVRIARGVCSSMREAHAIGIVHRDLKPANIHLEHSALELDYVKVLDFGIAKRVDLQEPNRDLTLAGQLVGTFDYMAPEQMIGGMTTGRSDVFTLGVVIYEMIGGERPFGDAKGPASALMQMLGTTPRSLAVFADVPPALDAIVQRAIQCEPELRPDVVELDEELARILDAAGPEPLAEGSVDLDLAEAGVDDGRFTGDDGPTWVDPVAPPRAQSPARTMLGTFSPVAPARPSEFAVGSRTAIAPVSTATMQRPSTSSAPHAPGVARIAAAPPPAPPAALQVRFRAPSAQPPPRLPSGTTPIRDHLAGLAVPAAYVPPGRAEPQRGLWLADFARGFVYALVILAVAAAIAVYVAS